MPQPTRSDVHVNRPLTNMSIAYIQKSEDFIADKVFPIVPVMKQSDRYFVYTKDYWFRTDAQKRAPATESAGGGFKVDNTPSYYADVWAQHMDIDDQTRANQDEPLNLDRDATEFVTQGLLLRRELQWTSAYFATGVWTGNPGGDYNVGTASGSIQWDLANSNPIATIDYLKQLIKSQTGFMPNTFVVAMDVFTALKNNASVLDRIKYTQRGLVTEELLASLLGVSKFLVSSAVVNTAAEGAAFVGQFITQNQALLVYANPAPSILQPTGGYIFSWQGLFGAGAQGNRIKSFRMEHLSADRIEGEMAFSMKLIGPDMGVLLTNILSVA